MRIFVFLAAFIWIVPASALEIVPVREGVFAIVGELGQRSPKNANWRLGQVATGA